MPPWLPTPGHIPTPWQCRGWLGVRAEAPLRAPQATAQPIPAVPTQSGAPLIHPIRKLVTATGRQRPQR
jgi:hypothetical protein